jgi:hypothetical protein
MQDSHNLEITNKPFRNVEEFKYLGTTVTYRNWIHEEYKSRLNLEIACYHSVQDLFVFLSPKNLKIKIM